PLAPSPTTHTSTSVAEAAAVPIPPTPSATSTSNPLSPSKPLAVRPRSRSPLQPSTTTKDLSFLLHPSHFRKISQTDISPPFRSTPAAPDTTLPGLLRQGHYYRAATLAVSSLVLDSDLSQKEIFELLYVRLACLTLLNHTSLAGKESLALGDIHSPFYIDDHGECILPWELRVLAVRLQALKSGDARRGVQGYYDLAAYARNRTRGTSDAEVKGMWKDRLRGIGVRVGNALVEMGDLEAGRRHFETLAEATTNSEEKTALSSWVAMLCLRMGDLEGARAWTHGDQEAGEVSTIDAPSPTTGQKHDVLKPLLNMAEGDYETAVTEWRSLLNGPHNVLAKQNLAVCLLYTGHLSQTSQLLEELVNEDHAFYALTFNLATVYELSTDRSRDRKMQLAERVAEGLRRKDAEVEGRRIERSNMNFKL
ncbi:MAG: hypothetical protein L6R42_008299, partial [Xanthoria sp. 1 TBL-2021]